MRETPRSQGTAGDSRAEPPQPRSGRALAHTTGAFGSGTPHRSDGRPPQTPRGARQTGPAGHCGTTPPVPKWPASFLVALPALCALLFAVVTWQVAADGPLRSLDERIELKIVGSGPSTLTGLLADLGSMAVALPVLAAAIAYALWSGRRPEALYAALAMAAVPALVVPLKALIDRQGPLTEATGYYPSGHTATAMVAYCGAALLVRAKWTMPVAVLLTVATGIGLVLRGYHWPLDVLGSWCLCGMLLWVTSRRRRSSSRTPTG
ncbi:phosphatase PAP2 family protein [Streptomyces lunaelactis]|uniref:phosphatase PAP2 family protein n=1 Tax=Streptomyces lunaelactis TaxID=1535768 RepID=UPI001584A2B3|nr:phosphatase PAP2 family protein [Streptomyces lunaelactis]NUK05044.1 phosphatase PAP2 family protein [Streptomyces lunaelactis]NUK18590.1 phosphatase PAP2 family protein [Streptomyces lunaelactis]NUK51828.1 phosphatase PAP2 family protein [Streptomyces lunaelactis]NUK65867.1 phosphatase PAP2 family protein [Streptomyces lunaelactis]